MQQQQQTVQEPLKAIEEVPVGSIKVGPVGINYGSIWLDVLAGTIIFALVCLGYYLKKKIDKKFK